MRLNKFIASCGICSRRKADDLIQLGKIKVNGVLINTPGVNIDEESDIVESTQIGRASCRERV